MAALTITVWKIDASFQKKSDSSLPPIVITHQPPALIDGPVLDHGMIASLELQTPLSDWSE